MDKIIKELAQYANDLRVLFVEDDDGVRIEITNLLAGLFGTVDNAANGQDGLGKYKHHNYDIVISDIKMPVMNGIEMVKEIKKINKEQSIIMISAHDEPEYLLDLINVDIDKFILKPIENQKFLSALLYVCKAIVNERELFKYRSNLEAIFRSVKEAIVTVDKELRVLEINKAAEEICGFPGNKKAKGKKYESLLNECNGKCLEALTETINTKRPSERSRFECNNKCQSEKIVSVSTYPLLDTQGKSNGCVIVVRDETRLANLESNLNERQQFHNIVGKSEKLQKVYTYIEAMAYTQTTVLITGENGTGKGLVAEALHYHEMDNKKPFVVVNCTALSDNLLESELFGHVKGAYTGAVSDRVGRFQKADGGTIFLDEIGDISNTMQLRLLKVLQEMEFERVGDSNPIKVDVRIIAATNQDLRKKVRYGKFREDLYHRLKVIEINIPPLRERSEDIPLLFDYFKEKLNKKTNKNITSMSADVQKLFMDYSWPGNVRELFHTLEHAFVFCNKSTITMDNLPPDFGYVGTANFQPAKGQKHIDQQSIVQALKDAKWNKTKAAQMLGVSRGTLYLKMQEFDITHV